MGAQRHLLGLGFIGDVHPKGKRLAPLLGAARGGLGTVLNIGERQAGAVSGQADRVFPPQPRRRAGDKDHLVIEPAHYWAAADRGDSNP